MANTKEGLNVITKTEEDLNELKEEVKALSAKLNELTKDELEQVTGGIWYPFKN